MLVIINGSSGSGKDEFVKITMDEFFDVISIYNRSTIDPAKEAMRCLGWNGDRTPKDRQMMVDIKKAWIKRDEFACTNYVRGIYNIYKDFNDSVIVFVHCREPEEIHKIVEKMPDVKTLLVSGRGTAYENGADNMVNDYSYDYYVFNDGTLDDLRKNVIKFINWLTNKE